MTFNRRDTIYGRELNARGRAVSSKTIGASVCRPRTLVARERLAKSFGGLVLNVFIQLVDGGSISWDESDDLYARYKAAVENGLEGRRLVHELLTDDWAAPPLGIYITGTTASGERVDLVLDYPRQRSGGR